MDETYTFKRGVLDAAPTMLGYLSIGLTVGILGVSAHLPIWFIVGMSIFVYAQCTIAKHNAFLHLVQKMISAIQ
ncbi:hypothetical protein H7R52_01615 [Weissella confusa]|uniref:Uncharacterized protein n=1 Tax=Weissella confusa TaxID=1583 RepID=A0A923NG97_WEICO|nr:hypothetical protein [Weissella confusa]